MPALPLATVRCSVPPIFERGGYRTTRNTLGNLITGVCILQVVEVTVSLLSGRCFYFLFFPFEWNVWGRFFAVVLGKIFELYYCTGAGQDRYLFVRYGSERGNRT